MDEVNKKENGRKRKHKKVNAQKIRMRRDNTKWNATQDGTKLKHKKGENTQKEDKESKKTNRMNRKKTTWGEMQTPEAKTRQDE